MAGNNNYEIHKLPAILLFRNWTIPRARYACRIYFEKRSTAKGACVSRRSDLLQQAFRFRDKIVVPVGWKWASRKHLTLGQGTNFMLMQKSRGPLSIVILTPVEGTTNACKPAACGSISRN